ncbi:hypothetical protein [Halobacillus naozhouensis]|uniref:Uncharacterized protein n=1 Tax=Halobacillus naozhouensis TaxID=554880 RepID=A0ABY8J1R6_9BACI|nr:hypothetical protein [Halobacillus naozhouensis]WFT76442.1 hypothetical protein P9989_08785 [Halobacillus naozhouensis]
MDMVLIFLLLATVAPFMFMNLKKVTLAVIQTILLVGMWVYYFQALFVEAPAVLSFPWLMFYLGLILSEVAWVMMIINVVHSTTEYRKNYE